MPDTVHLPPIREFADRGVQWLLSRPENLRGLLQILAPNLAAAVDCARAQMVPTTFIPDDLRKQESDVIHLVPYRDPASGKVREIWIYILIEHQSRPDPTMGLRLLLYMAELWDMQRREYLGQKTPVSQWRLHPIVPIVFYTGRRRWQPDLSVAALMDLPSSLREFTPRFHALYLPLKQIPPQSLTAKEHPFGWVLKVMRAEDAPPADMESALQETATWLEGLSRKDRVAWAEALHFLWLLIHHRRPAEEHERLEQVLLNSIRARRRREEVSEMFKTMIDVWREEGEARGEARGRVEGMIKAKQEDVLRLLTLKFGDVPAEIVQRVQAIRDVEKLDGLLEQVWRASSLKDLRWRPRKQARESSPDHNAQKPPCPENHFSSP
jgi:predicted transposase/invertase (TIGR01784 family)